MKRICVLLFVIFAFVTNAQNLDNRKNTLTQVSTIDALLAGVYDGIIPISDIPQYGTFGLGTFDKLDGEMIVYDGVVYQFKTDGKIYTPDGSVTTPFISVVNFESDLDFPIGKMAMKDFTAKIDSTIKNKNLMYAIKVTGTFSYIKTRSVPVQEKPYPPLAEVTKKQSVFERENVKGTLIGFRLPSFFSGVNVPGYHIHFLQDDKSFGGHVLDFTISDAKVEIQEINKFNMILPEDNSAFSNIDLSKDRSKELEKVEK